MARCVSGSLKPKKSGPEMRCPVRCATHTSVHGLVGEAPLNVAPVCVSTTCGRAVRRKEGQGDGQRGMP